MSMGSTGLTDRPIEASWESSPRRLWDRPWPRFSTAGAAMTTWTAPLIKARRVLPPPWPTVTMPPGRNWAHSASLLKKLHYPSEISRSGCLRCQISWWNSKNSPTGWEFWGIFEQVIKEVFERNLMRENTHTTIRPCMMGITNISSTGWNFFGLVHDSRGNKFVLV